MKELNRLVFCIIVGCVAMASFAQSESQTKEINKIKLDPGYVFAESTMENADEARETVCLTLSNFMNEYLEESGESRRVAAAELGAIKYINAKRGNATYVFGYIPVATFSSSAPAPLAVENTVAEEPVVTQPESVVAQPEPAVMQPVAENTQATVAPQPETSVEDDYAEVSPEQQAMGGAALGMLFGNVFDQPSSSQTKISCHGNPADSGQLSDMISRLGETPQGISHRLQKLAAKGYLETEEAKPGRRRGESRKTKRIKIAFLPESEPVLAELRQAEAEDAELRFLGFTEYEREIYQELTEKMNHNMRRILSNYGSIVSPGI